MATTSRVSAGLRASKVWPLRGSTPLPSMTGLVRVSVAIKGLLGIVQTVFTENYAHNYANNYANNRGGEGQGEGGLRVSFRVADYPRVSPWLTERIAL